MATKVGSTAATSAKSFVKFSIGNGSIVLNLFGAAAMNGQSLIDQYNAVGSKAVVAPNTGNGKSKFVLNNASGQPFAYVNGGSSMAEIQDMLVSCREWHRVEDFDVAQF